MISSPGINQCPQNEKTKQKQTTTNAHTGVSTFHRILMHCGMPRAQSLLTIGLSQHYHKQSLKIAYRYSQKELFSDHNFNFPVKN